MIQFIEGRFKAYKQNGNEWMEYLCWFDSPRSVRFVINDGRVPGNSAGLPSDEFWTLFATRPKYGIREINTLPGVQKSNPLGLWVNTKNDWPWRSTARSTAASWPTIQEATARLAELRAEAAKRGTADERYAAMLKVDPLPPLMESEVAEVARHLESIGMTSLQSTRRIMRGNLGDRSTSKAANVDNMVANRWQIAWEIINGIRPLPTANDLVDMRPTLADECFVNADFGWQVKDANGWEKTEEHKLHRTVFFEGEGDKPSFKGTLHCEFYPDNEALKDCWLEWADNDDVLDMEQLGLRPSSLVP